MTIKSTLKKLVVTGAIALALSNCASSHRISRQDGKILEKQGVIKNYDSAQKTIENIPVKQAGLIKELNSKVGWLKRDLERLRNSNYIEPIRLGIIADMKEAISRSKNILNQLKLQDFDLRPLALQLSNIEDDLRKLEVSN